MKVHELKIEPQYFEAVVSSKKTFEIRKDDRGFKVGDLLVLKEYTSDRHTNQFGEERSENYHYTGREVKALISYIFRGGAPGMGLKKGYSILSIKQLK